MQNELEILDNENENESYTSDGKFTDIGVKRRINKEGIGYAILHWRIEGKKCRNPKLGQLIDKAYESLRELENYVDSITKGRE